MATKAKSPAKVTLHSALPVKGKPLRVETICLQSAEELVRLWAIARSPTPKGEREDLVEALAILPIRANQRLEAEAAIHHIARVYLLNRHDESGLRSKDVKAILRDITTAAALLDARIGQLPTDIATRLQIAVHNASPIKDNSSFWHDTRKHLESIVTFATKTEKGLPSDKGGKALPLSKLLAKHPGGIDPVEGFLRSTVSLFAKHAGEKKTTAIISENKKCCYRFVVAVFRYTMGEDFMHPKLFELFMKRRRARIVSMKSAE